MDEERGPVSLSPYRALVECRFQFAVLTDDLAIMSNKQQRCIDSTLRPLIEFGYSDCYIQLGLLCRLAKSCGLRPRDFDSACDVGTTGLKTASTKGVPDELPANRRAPG